MNNIPNEIHDNKNIAEDTAEYGLLAVMMGTHNHPSVVKEILELSAADYHDLGIDIYYYDSSNNDATRVLVEEYKGKGYDNIYYVPCPGLNLHEKMDWMFQGKGLKKKYKYLWPSKDRCSYKKKYLVEIIDTLQEDYDALHLIENESGTTEYDSALEFYHDWGTWVTSVNTMVYNAETLMKDLPFSDKKLGEEDYLFHFKHYYYFFYQLTKLNHVRIRVLNSSNQINMLYVPKTETLELIKVWKDRWIEVNDALPDFYDPYKDYVIKVTAELPWVIADRKRLEQFHKDGVLTEETLPIFLHNWERLTDIPKSVVIKIANSNYDIKYDLSQIQGYDQLIDNICSFAFLLREGFMEADTFPYEMARLSVNAFLARLRDDDIRERLIKEVGESIWNEMARKGMNSEELANHLQQLVAVLI